MQHVCRILNLYDDMMFGIFVSKAAWCAKDKRWSIFANNELLATAQFYLPCTGYTGKKYIPNYKGLSTFTHAYHTSEWPAELDVADKRVGVSMSVQYRSHT